MDSKLDYIVNEKKKPAKLAPEEEDRGGLLIPLYPELDDSGIDSDDTEATRAQRLHLIDASSSDEEPIVKPPWVRAMKKRNDELLKVMEDDQESPDMLMPMLPWDYHQQLSHQVANAETNSDRASPPLFEVELTTSDEDDDGSVLELVIPMQQSSRYQRVSTSSPKKSKSKSPKFFYNLLCCVRK